MVSFDDFGKLEMRLGIIVTVEDFPEAKVKPSYKVQIDFGSKIGLKWSVVGARREYTKEDLKNRQVIGIVNLPPKKIAGFSSEVLLLGVEMEDNSLSLLEPSRKPAKIGSKVY